MIENQTDPKLILKLLEHYRRAASTQDASLHLVLMKHGPAENRVEDKITMMVPFDLEVAIELIKRLQ